MNKTRPPKLFTLCGWDTACAWGNSLFRFSQEKELNYIRRKGNRKSKTEEKMLDRKKGTEIYKMNFGQRNLGRREK